MPHTQFRTHWTEALVKGEIGLHQLPATLSRKEASRVRREALQRITGSPLGMIGDYTFDAQRAKCENFIGAIQIPVGVAGPLLVNGRAITAREPVYAPLATTEGALIASVSRGCSALRAAGGAVVRVDDVGITRAPVFRSSGIIQTQAFLAWVQTHFDEIKQLCEQDSHHLTLQDIAPAAVGCTIYLRFRFNSADAMGMNMASIACDRAITELISPATGVPCISISGNYCTDKKPAMVNFLNGRGKRIYAEACLSSDIVRDILKTDAASLCEVQYRKNLLGSAMAGAIGCNAHHANILAAFFIATGQDVAQVAESAMGITCIEDRGNGALYASILLPDTPLGTVGGGTGLCTQREALALMGIVPGAKAPGVDTLRLAEILGALVLAGELSIMAAQASHHLVQAHVQLGRRTMTSTIIQARAPGKIILMGEHAVLHGCPAIATSLGLYCTINVRPREDGRIELQLPDLNLHRCYTFQTVLDYVRRVRQSSAQGFAYGEGTDADHLVKCAIGEILLRLAPEDWRGFSLRVESSIPANAGFGSSGALAVSLAAALLRFFNLKPPRHPLEPLAMSIERYQHGQPSGIDHNTSLRGSTVERRPMANGSFKLISWPKSAAWLQLRDVELYDTGTARESTGQVIAATRYRLEGPDNPLLESMRHSAERFRSLLQRPVLMPETLKHLLRDYEQALECLGVVPKKIAKVIRAIERVGGAAKICGAGALSGDQAGALLVIGAPALPELAQFRRINAPLAVDGLQVSET